jgi:hypothetical protein
MINAHYHADHHPLAYGSMSAQHSKQSLPEIPNNYSSNDNYSSSTQRENSSAGTTDMHSVLYSLKDRNAVAYAFWTDFFADSLSIPKARFLDALAQRFPEKIWEYSKYFEGFENIDPQVFSILVNGKLADAFATS